MPPPRPRVRWSPTALQDIRDIGDYLSKAVPLQVAVRIFTTIDGAVARVAKKPLQARSRADIRLGLRGALAGSYIVFYRPDQNGVEIVRVLHQRRDLASAFEESDPDH